MGKRIERFVFIDDDPVNNLICQLTIELVLGKISYKSFTSPEEGLKYLRESFLAESSGTPTVLLLDINMPVMSGWEFLEHFDHLSAKGMIQVYILSSSVDDRDRERSYANKNVKEFLVKPLTKEIILQLFQEEN